MDRAQELAEEQVEHRRPQGGGQTTEQRVAEMQTEFDDINSRLEAFLDAGPGRNGTTITLDNAMGTIEYLTMRQAREYYLKEFNDGYIDPDTSIMVQYNDGSLVSSNDLGEGERFKLRNINAVIIEGGWGTSIAGNAGNIELYNWREAVYHEHLRGDRYAPRDIETVLNYENDIRADFRRRS